MQANRAALAELKAFQEKVRLEDEVAAEAIKEASRAYVEDVLEKGIASTKKRTRVRDYSEAVRVRGALLSRMRTNLTACLVQAERILAAWRAASGPSSGPLSTLSAERFW